MHSLRRFRGNSTKTLQKLCAQQKSPYSEIRQNPHTSCITKKAVNQFATQINLLVSIRDELLSKDISKQTEFRFAISEQTLADNHQQMTGNLFYV